MSDRADDLRVLRACVSEWDCKRDLAEDDGVDEPNWYEPFASMLADLENGKWDALTERQRAWVRGVHERLFDEPIYLNLHSAGKVPRGLREVPTPEVLTRRPLKPPSGRA
jgi:hypothetical protein